MEFKDLRLDDNLYCQCEVFSFDLFDTVLLRHVKRPSHLFYFVGLEAEAYTGISPLRFLKYRVLAQKICRLRVRLFSFEEEFLITDIYQMLGKLLALDKHVLALLIAEELRQEKSLIYPNPKATAVIKSLVDNGRKVIFTSDMYLPFDFLYGILEEIGIIQAQNQLYLSSLVGKRKRTGSLFKYVLEKEDVPPERLVHIGDHRQNDYEVPFRQKIRAICYRRKSPDVAWLPSIGDAEVHEGLLREVSKQIYLASSDEGIENSLAILGAYIGGPVLFSYVHWLMWQAANSKIKVIYFLARDGQILLRIAQLLRAKYGFDIELRYLYASRHSWLLPSVLDYDKIYAESKFFTFSKKLSLNRLLYRFKMENVEADWLTEKIKKTGLQPDESITLMNLKKAKGLFADREVTNQIRKIGKQEFASLSGYLRQEGLFGDANYALVDVGWRGSLPRALRRIFSKNGVREKGFTTFYFDLRRSQAFKAVDQYKVFLSETGNQYNPLRAEMETLMEVLTAATHESTYGFEAINGEFKPVFIEEDMDIVDNWGLEKLQNVMVDFACNLINHPCFEQIPPESVYHLSLQNFYEFLNNPTRQMSAKIAQFPYTVQQIKKQKEEYDTICSPYRLKDFLVLLRNINLVRPNDLWIQGSLSLTESILTRMLFRLFYKSISSAPARRIEYLIRNVATH